MHNILSAKTCLKGLVMRFSGCHNGRHPRQARFIAFSLGMFITSASHVGRLQLWAEDHLAVSPFASQHWDACQASRLSRSGNYLRLCRQCTLCICSRCKTCWLAICCYAQHARLHVCAVHNAHLRNAFVCSSQPISCTEFSVHNMKLANNKS